MAGRQVIFDMHVHLVFTTKYRRGVLSDRVRSFLQPVMAKICADAGATLDAFDGEDDHVHLLVSYPPKVAISTLVNSLKGASSRLLRNARFEEIIGAEWGDAFWSPSYCAVSCGGAPLEVIKSYIENQRNPAAKNRKGRLTSP